MLAVALLVVLAVVCLAAGIFLLAGSGWTLIFTGCASAAVAVVLARGMTRVG